MKKCISILLSFLIIFVFVASLPNALAEEKILNQTSFMIPVVSGSTTYVEVPFVNPLDVESKYTVSITRKLRSGCDMKIELDDFSVQEKYDVGPLAPKEETTFGIRILCSEEAEKNSTMSAKVLIGSMENSRLSAIVNIYVIVRDKTTLEMHTTNADAMVNGEEITLDTPPLVIQGRTMVPFRWIGEQLGAKVAFSMSEETRKVDTVSYQIGKQTITLCIGSTDATSTIDRETMPCKLDVAPFIKDGRTLVPLRFVSEILGADVSWTPPNTIGIVYPKEIPVRENECVSFWTDIDQADLQKMIEEKKEFTLIDARDQGSYNDGHIPGAINIHVDMLPDEFEKATPETENMEIVVYCKSGRFSKQASEWLVNQGYKNVQSLTGGFASWKGETEKTEE